LGEAHPWDKDEDEDGAANCTGDEMGVICNCGKLNPLLPQVDTVESCETGTVEKVAGWSGGTYEEVNAGGAGAETVVVMLNRGCCVKVCEGKL